MTRLRLDAKPRWSTRKPTKQEFTWKRGQVFHTREETTVSVFVAVNKTSKALKSPVPVRQRVDILVLKVFYSNKTERKSISSEKPVSN